jgi:pimeloyl-ACP methyl ester carboxylesterase
MPYSLVNGVSIYYETVGDGEPTIFIGGFSAQLIAWHQEFCQKLVDRGLFVIRLDNRDVGLSQKFGGPADAQANYTLTEMADDVFGVLDTLGFASAHVVGQSMGGMIAQVMAIARPERVRSLSLIYTLPGMEYLTDEAKEHLGSGQIVRYATRAEVIEASVAQEKKCSSTEYAFDEEWIRALAGLSYDRCYAPDGVARQASAVRSSGNRLENLKSLGMPVAIVHGRADRLVRAEASVEMARAMKNAELHLYSGMGHELVRSLWDEVANIVARTVARTKTNGRTL